MAGRIRFESHNYTVYKPLIGVARCALFSTFTAIKLFPPQAFGRQAWGSAASWCLAIITTTMLITVIFIFYAHNCSLPPETLGSARVRFSHPCSATPALRPVFDFRAHFCHSAPMETPTSGFGLRANAPEGQKRFPISSEATLPLARKVMCGRLWRASGNLDGTVEVSKPFCPASVPSKREQ